MDPQKIKQRIVGTIILIFIIAAVILLILSFSSGKNDQTPKPDQAIFAVSDSGTQTATVQAPAVSATTQATTAPAVVMTTSSASNPNIANAVGSSPAPAPQPVVSTTASNVVPAVVVPAKVSSTKTTLTKNFGQVAPKKSVTTAKKVVHHKRVTVSQKHHAVHKKSAVKTHAKHVAKKHVVKKHVTKKHVATKAKHHYVHKKSVTKKTTVKHHATDNKIKPGWSVKMGSFSSPINAQKLVKKLRAKGHKVYTVLVFSEKHGVLTQVLAGPAKNEYRAKLLLKAIEKSCGMKGVVVHGK